MIDDYGHHPTEIRATLATARAPEPGAAHLPVPAASLHAHAAVEEGVRRGLRRRGRAVRHRRLCREREAAAGRERRDDPRRSPRAVPGQGVPLHAHADRGARHGSATCCGPATCSSRSARATSTRSARCLARDLKVAEELHDILKHEGGGVVKLYEPMANHTTIRIGGPAQFWIEPRTVTGFPGDRDASCAARASPSA